VLHLRGSLLNQIPFILKKTHNILQSPENCQKRSYIRSYIAYIIFYIMGLDRRAEKVITRTCYQVRAQLNAG
jgi:hypothetical protein